MFTLWALMPQFIKHSSLLEFLRWFPSSSQFVVYSPNADGVRSVYLVSLFPVIHYAVFSLWFGFLPRDGCGLSVSRAEMPCTRTWRVILGGASWVGICPVSLWGSQWLSVLMWVLLFWRLLSRSEFLLHLIKPKGYLVYDPDCPFKDLFFFSKKVFCYCLFCFWDSLKNS